MVCRKKIFLAEKGFALVLTLGVLTLLAILAVTFATSMQIEEKAAVNYSLGVKALFFAQTGLNHALYYLKYDDTPLYDAYSTDDWRLEFDGTNAGETPDVDLYDESDDGLDNDNNGTADDEANGDEAIWQYVHEDSSDSSTPIIGRYAVLVIDEASKVNINCAGDGTQNQGVTPWEIDMTQLSFLSAADAASIIQYVTGGDNFPGDAGDDDSNDTFAEDNGIDEDADTAGYPDGSGPAYIDTNEGVNDPGERFFPGSNDVELTMIDFVTKIYDTYGFDNNQADVEDLVKATTIFSSSSNLYYNDGEGGDSAASTGDDTTPDWRNKICLNAIEDTAQLYTLMVDEISFPEYNTTSSITDGERDVAVSRNYPLKIIANIIDYADRDCIVTALTAPDASVREIGAEGLQINEVMTYPRPQIPGDTANTINGLVLTNDMYVAQNVAPWYTQIPHGGGWNVVNMGDAPNTIHVSPVPGTAGTWAWPFDAGGTYYIQIKLDASGGGGDWVLENGEPGQVSGYKGHNAISGQVFDNGLVDVGNVTIGADGILNLQLTDRMVDAGNSMAFDHIYVLNVGEFVEIINYSEQDIVVDITSASSQECWKLRVDSGGWTDYNLKTNAINNPVGNITLKGCRYDNTDTTRGGNTQDRRYDYLVICDSEYALDYGYRPAWGRGNGWDEDDNTATGLHDEPGHLIVIPTFDLPDAGADLYLFDGRPMVDDNILAVATVLNSTGAAGWGIDGYNDPANGVDSVIQPNHSMRRRSPSATKEQWDSGAVQAWRYTLELRSSDDSSLIGAPPPRYDATKIAVRDFSVGGSNDIYGLQFDGTPGGDNGRTYVDGVAGLSQAEIDDFTNEFFNALSITEKRAHIKDRPFGTVGELGNVVESHKSSTLGADWVQMLVDAFTVDAIRIEAESAGTSPGGGTTTADDGTLVYTSAAGTWIWTNGDAGVRFEDDEAYDIFVIGTRDDMMNVTATSGANSVNEPFVDLSSNNVGGLGAYADGVAPYDCGYVGSLVMDGSDLQIDIISLGNATLNAIMLVPAGETTAAWGRININTATRDTLLCLPQITATGTGPGVFDTVDVDDIISRREGTGPFESIGQLLDDDVTDMYIYRDDVSDKFEHDEFNFRAISNLVTVRSDAFTVIVLGQSIWDVDGDGDENNCSSEDLITGEKKIEALVERIYGEGTAAPEIDVASYRIVLED